MQKSDREDTLKVGYLGPPGSYTHSAALQCFPPSEGHELIPSPTIPSVFAAVQSESCDRSVVPFENSTNGSVVTTLDLFADHQRTNPDVRVCGEAFVVVRHCLVGRRGTWQQGPPAIKTLYSHPQAWTQCTAFLSQLSHAERIDTSSTSKAAEIVAADSSGASAAVSSKEAAELFGLDVLEEGIESVKGNTTRFLVLCKDDRFGGQSQRQARAGKTAKTLVSFTVQHDDPGALARALGVFGKHGVNLTSINARPSLERPWHYLFFVEFMGYYVPGVKAGKDEEIALTEDVTHVYMAMEELERSVELWKWCGCWWTG